MSPVAPASSTPCSTCGESYPPSEYQRRRKQCRACRRAAQARWREENRDRVREQRERAHQAAPEKRRERQARWWKRRAEALTWKRRCQEVKRLFGLERGQYEAMIRVQQNLCAVCGCPPPIRYLAVDHDHDTGEVRALLCRNCNLGIANFRENIHHLHAAADYLERFGAR